jgi:predicted transcriptional regulator
MGRRRALKLTPRETAIMEVLWTSGEATSEQIRARFPGGDAPHDSTIRTLLRILETKGHVTHESLGRAFVYRPTIHRSQAQRSALRDILARFFGGSPEALVLRMIEDEQITVEELKGIRRRATSDGREPARRNRAKRPKSNPDKVT